MERYAGLSPEMIRLARTDVGEMAEMILKAAQTRGESFALSVVARVINDNQGNRRVLQKIHDRLVDEGRRRLAQKFRREAKEMGHVVLKAPSPSARGRQAGLGHTIKKIFGRFPRDSRAKRGRKHQVMLTGDTAKVLKRKNYDTVFLEDLSEKEVMALAKLMIARLHV